MGNKWLLTGATGFLGREITAYYQTNKITTLGISVLNDISCDLPIIIPSLVDFFDVVIHCAGKAHSVPKNEAEKQAFFDVNVKGTENLLKGLEQASSLPKSFVFISSVAVYGVESDTNINEDYPLLALDPYGLSKIQAEQLVQQWCKEHNVTCGILRLPLLVGANPPGNLGSMIKAIKKEYYFNIAGGKTKKSMVMAEDVANIIPKLAEIGGVYNLTDGYHPSFFELSHHIANQLGKKDIINMPHILAKGLAKIGDIFNKFPLNSTKLNKLTSDLTFDDNKARILLGWKPSKVLDSFNI